MTRNSISKLQKQKSFQEIIEQDKYLMYMSGHLLVLWELCTCVGLHCFDGKEGVFDSTSIDHRTCTSSYWQDFTSSYRMYIPLPEKKCKQIALEYLYNQGWSKHNELQQIKQIFWGSLWWQVKKKFTNGFLYKLEEEIGFGWVNLLSNLGLVLNSWEKK
jgi:hypothetical protein